MTEELQNEQLSPRMDHYELLYIIAATYTVDELKPIVEKIAGLIKDQNGKITKDDDLGKIKLAYPIKHQNHGFYRLYEFDLPKSNLQNLNRALSLTQDVIRFIIAKKQVKTETAIKKEKALQEKLAKKKEKAIEKIKSDKEEAKEKPKKEKVKEKISLEDLDKKLDEILDTKDVI